MARTSHLRNALLLAVLASTPGLAMAVEPLDRLGFSAGTYVNRVDTTLRADGRVTGAGTSIDLKRDLGLDTGNQLAFARLTWRPFERHEFGLSYYGDSVSADHRLQHDIVFEDDLYQADATVHANLSLKSLEGYYTWWAMSSEDWALGPRLGLTVYRVDLGLKATLDVNGNPVGSGALEDRYRGDLPAPTLGLGWRWTPAQDWRISADAGWLSTEINGIDGTVTYARVGAEWHRWKHVGLLLEYNYTDISASTERNHFTGNLDMRDSGLRLGVVIRR